MSAPWSALPLLELMRLVDEFRGPDLPSNPQPPPIVVHCSAGVGRTGAYLVVDANVRQLREVARFRERDVGTVGLVNVLDYLSQIRAHRRPGLVQQMSQLIFIHMALVEFVKARGLRSFSRPELLQFLARQRAGPGVGGGCVSSSPPRPNHVSVPISSSSKSPSTVTNSSSVCSASSKSGANGSARASQEDHQSNWNLEQQFEVCSIYTSTFALCRSVIYSFIVHY